MQHSLYTKKYISRLGRGNEENYYYNISSNIWCDFTALRNVRIQKHKNRPGNAQQTGSTGSCRNN